MSSFETSRSAFYVTFSPSVIGPDSVEGYAVAVADDVAGVVGMDGAQWLGRIPVAQLTIEAEVPEVPRQQMPRANRGLRITPVTRPLSLSPWSVSRASERARQFGLLIHDSSLAGLVVVVGCPLPYYLEEVLRVHRSRVEVVSVGRARTREMFGPGGQLAAVIDAFGVAWRHIDCPVDEFASCGIDFSTCVYLLVGLSVYRERLLSSAQIASLHMPVGSQITGCGPAIGALIAGTEPILLRSFPFGSTVHGGSHLRAPAVHHTSSSLVVSAQRIAPSPPQPIVDPSQVISNSTLVATWGAGPVLDRLGLDDTERLRRAERYVRGLSSFGSHSQAVGQSFVTSLGLDPRIPDFCSPHVPNWEHWCRQAANGSAFLEIGVMTGASGEWFRQHLAPNITQSYSLEAAEVWDPLSGVDKLAWIEQEQINVGELLVGATGITGGLMVARMLADGVEARVIYHDGSHTADDTCLDLEQCFRMLAIGGVLIMDDFIYDPITGDGPSARAVYAGRRGALAFEKLHEGDLERLAPCAPTSQVAWKKIRGTVRLTAIPSLPFVEPDRTTLWQGNQPTPDLRAPWDDGHCVVDGEHFWDALEHQSMAAAGALALPRAGGAILGGLLDVGHQAGVSIGNMLAGAGEWVGHGQQHNAIAGLGNAVKSVGRASEIAGEGMGVAAKWLFGRK